MNRTRNVSLISYNGPLRSTSDSKTCYVSIVDRDCHKTCKTHTPSIQKQFMESDFQNILQDWASFSEYHQTLRIYEDLPFQNSLFEWLLNTREIKPRVLRARLWLLTLHSWQVFLPSVVRNALLCRKGWTENSIWFVCSSPSPCIPVAAFE